MLAVPFVHTTLVAVVFFGLVRFRAPAEVALVVLAAVALTAPWRRHNDPDPAEEGASSRQPRTSRTA